MVGHLGIQLSVSRTQQHRGFGRDRNRQTGGKASGSTPRTFAGAVDRANPPDVGGLGIKGAGRDIQGVVDDLDEDGICTKIIGGRLVVGSPAVRDRINGRHPRRLGRLGGRTGQLQAVPRGPGRGIPAQLRSQRLIGGPILRRRQLGDAGHGLGFAAVDRQPGAVKRSALSQRREVDIEPEILEIVGIAHGVTGYQHVGEVGGIGGDEAKAPYLAGLHIAQGRPRDGDFQSVARQLLGAHGIADTSGGEDLIGGRSGSSAPIALGRIARSRDQNAGRGGSGVVGHTQHGATTLGAEQGKSIIYLKIHGKRVLSRITGVQKELGPGHATQGLTGRNTRSLAEIQKQPDAIAIGERHPTFHKDIQGVSGVGEAQGPHVFAQSEPAVGVLLDGHGAPGRLPGYPVEAIGPGAEGIGYLNLKADPVVGGVLIQPVIDAGRGLVGADGVQGEGGETQGQRVTGFDAVHGEGVLPDGVAAEAKLPQHGHVGLGEIRAIGDAHPGLHLVADQVIGAGRLHGRHLQVDGFIEGVFDGHQHGVGGGLRGDEHPTVIKDLEFAGDGTAEVVQCATRPGFDRHPDVDVALAVFVDGHDEAGVPAGAGALGNIDVTRIIAGIARPEGLLKIAAGVHIGGENAQVAAGELAADLYEAVDLIAHAVVEVIAPEDLGVAGMGEHVGVGQHFVVDDGFVSVLGDLALVVGTVEVVVVYEGDDAVIVHPVVHESATVQGADVKIIARIGHLLVGEAQVEIEDCSLGGGAADLVEVGLQPADVAIVEFVYVEGVLGARLRHEPFEVFGMDAFDEIEAEAVEPDFVDEPVAPDHQGVAHGQVAAVAVMQGYIVPEVVDVELVEAAELVGGEEIAGVAGVAHGVGEEVGAALPFRPGDATRSVGEGEGGEGGVAPGGVQGATGAVGVPFSRRGWLPGCRRSGG